MAKHCQDKKGEDMPDIKKLSAKSSQSPSYIKRQLSEQHARELLQLHEEIIYGCLKQLKLYPNHPHYDDCVQVGRIALLAAYERFPQELERECEIYQFTGYAYTRVRWKIIDEIRKFARHHKKKAELTEQVIAHHVPKQGNQPLEKAEWTLLMEQFMKELTPQKRRIVVDLYKKKTNYTNLARHYGMSRRQFYRIRQKITQKWQALQELPEEGASDTHS
ncbi:sigma-70 family RNA polymerase sigma factor [Allofustis seminis]|uniref:sigma-70 family RNA polymerase sigma factor n=1 Tax=Allofustis seminis TaxID=166939 RepID=UPI0003648353|nr:sigma-70 family RNA polymerase sigma factor [Allofustis seminis]